MAREAQKHESAIEVLCRQRAPHLERDARDAYGEQLRRRRARVPANPDTAFAGPGTSPPAAGTEDPRELARTMPLVERAFGFVDLCGFTHFMDRHGEHAAIEALTTFRSLTREIATRRGIIVDKWLGDGAMLVGVSVGPIIAAGTELIGRYPGDPLHLRGGIAHGWVLILDGDDYIGRPANLAARLCQSARPGELLAVGYPAASLPPWTRVRGTRDLTLRGLGRFRRIQQLELADNLDLPPLRCVDVHPHRHGAWSTIPGEA